MRSMAGLHATIRGAGGAPRVVLLHGFTQTSASWAPLLEALAVDHQVVVVDLPGHGGSSAARLDLQGTAAAVAAIGGRAIYIGYSMGGRVALRLALDNPRVVERLIVIGTTAGIDDADARAERRRADEERAVALEGDGVDAFLDAWLTQPMLATLAPTPEDLASRRANDAAGLASSLRSCGTATMDPPWWDELGALGMAKVPVTVVVGEHDPKFTALGERLVAAIGPAAGLEVIAGTGHACHLERPAAFLAQADLA